MRIEKTETEQIGEIDYKLIECNNESDYIFINTTYHALITIDDYEYDLVWQNGISYYNNDYSMPSNKFYLNDEGGCHEMMESIENIDINRFNEVEAMELNRTYHKCFTTDEYLTIKNVIANMSPRFDNIFSSEPKDYDIKYIKEEPYAHGPYSIVTPKQ